MEALSDWPGRYEPGRRLLLAEGGNYRSLTVERSSEHKGKILLKVVEIADREEAYKICGSELVVPEEDLPELSQDEFWVHDLIGLRVTTEDGSEVGSVSDVILLPAHDIYVVKGPEEREILIPVVSEIVTSVDLESGIIMINPPKGLL